MNFFSFVTPFVAAATILRPNVLQAQATPPTRPVCWRAAPSPACRVIVVTNFGAYLLGGRHDRVVASDPGTGAPTAFAQRFDLNARATGDWGILVNIGRRDAVGASILGSLESTGHGRDAELGLFVVYRHWLGSERSLDVGLGTPVILRNSDAHGSPYGLLRLNLTHRVGLTLRPEVRRATDFLSGTPRTHASLFVSAGVEVGEKPGFFLSALGSAILGGLTLLDLHNSN